ncbi:urease accessory protein UreF [Kocuria carniphila]|uniref:urease accessory protein UreF n=1 Tax=Kocuria carniphila TaxID=262208 RepID=UPI0028E5CB99|nr:urease accessory protein UreF [Kocuria carniphila]
MLSSTTPHEPLLTLLQLCDSALPTGAFAHTFGMETYLQRGTVHDEATFQEWLAQFVDHQLVYADGLAVRLTAEACAAPGTGTGTGTGEDAQSGIDFLIELDGLMYAQALPSQVRQAGLTMGKRLLDIGRLSLPGPCLESYAALVDAGTYHGHQAIAFGLIGTDHGVPATSLVSAYLFSTVTALMQNAVRGIPIGQNAGQRVLGVMRSHVTRAEARIAQLTLDDLGAVSPGLEIAQMQHETQRARMFMS